MRCLACKQPCTTHEVDFGIGPYEYWGCRGVDHDWQTVSTCCDADFTENEDDEADPVVPPVGETPP